MLVVHIANLLFCFCVVFSANLAHVDIYTLFLIGASLSAGSAVLGATFLARASPAWGNTECVLALFFGASLSAGPFFLRSRPVSRLRITRCNLLARASPAWGNPECVLARHSTLLLAGAHPNVCPASLPCRFIKCTHVLALVCKRVLFVYVCNRMSRHMCYAACACVCMNQGSDCVACWHEVHMRSSPATFVF